MTNNVPAWDLVRNGDNKRGLDLLRQAVAGDASIGHMIELGVAYLWVEDYGAACKHFQDAINSTPQPPAEFFGLAGVAKWCSDDSEAAAAVWTAGLDALRTSDDDRGFRLPLLMFVAAILRPGDHPHKLKAWATLVPKLQYLEREAWPSVLVDITTGLRGYWGQKEVPELSPESPGEETSQREWLVGFYAAVRDFHLFYDKPPVFDPGKKARGLKKSMQKLADTAQPEWAETTAFQSLISHEEFFIARFLANAELQMPTAPPIEYDWANLRWGDGKEGIDVRTERYLREPAVSHALGLGVAYLWTKDYESAWNHIQYMNKHGRWTHARCFGMAGVAKWCLDQPGEAIECWKSGLHCNYMDSATVGTLLLLFAASILRKDLFPQSKVTKLLQKKASHSKIRSWPGPLVEFCLKKGNVELDMLEAYPDVEALRAVVKFYRSLLDFDMGVLSRDELNARMAEIADTSVPQWMEQKAFLRLVSHEEFFLARHEASRSGGFFLSPLQGE